MHRADLLVNGAVVATASIDDGRVTFTWPNGIPNGPATMTIRAKDLLGNVSEHTRTVTVDNDKPVVAVSPAAGALLRGIPTTSLTGYRDATGIAYLAAGIGAPTSVTFTAPWRHTINTTRHRDGRHNLIWHVIDKAGNRTVVTRPVTIDNTAPTVAFTKTPKNGTKLTKVATLTAAARDTNGIARVQFLVNGKVVATDTKAAYSFVLNPKKYGTKIVVNVRAYDKAGNLRYGAARTYRR